MALSKGGGLAVPAGSLLLLFASGCGGGTIANEDLPLPAILVIAGVLIAALLYVAYIGGKNR